MGVCGRVSHQSGSVLCPVAGEACQHQGRVKLSFELVRHIQENWFCPGGQGCLYVWLSVTDCRDTTISYWSVWSQVRICTALQGRSSLSSATCRLTGKQVAE